MIAFTEKQVAEAEAKAEAAELERTQAQAALAAAPYSDVAAQNLTVAAQKAAQRSANARELREALDQQRNAERTAASREMREKAAAKQIARVERELRAGRAQLETAAGAAQQGLVGLMEAADSYSALVTQHAHELAAVGLDLEGGETGGGERLMDTAAVRIRGEWHAAADPGSVLLWLAHRVADARLPWLHPARAALEGLTGHGAWERRDDGLLATVPAPARVKHPEVPHLLSADMVPTAGVRQ